MNWHFEQHVDLQHPSGVLSYPDLMMAQGDHLAHTWRVQVYSGGQPMDLTGYAVTGYFDRSDGKTVFVPGTAEGNTASVVLPQSVYAAAGPLTGLLRAGKDGQIITLAASRWNVRRGPGDEIVDPDHVAPSLEELLEKIGEMERKTHAANAAATAANTAAQNANDAVNRIEDRIEDRFTASERALLDKVCPPFEAEGSVVQCYPVEGYPLDVVTKIEAVQEGEGDPSPENVRPIVGWDRLELTRNGDAYTQALPETVYGGSYHWATGELVVEYAYFELPIDDLGDSTEYPGWSGYGGRKIGIGINAVLKDFKCNMFNKVRANTMNYNDIIFIRPMDFGYKSGAEIKALYPGAICQLAAKMEQPEIYHLPPQQILAIPGVNTLFSNAGDTTVSGRADPIRITQSVLDRLSALEGAQTGL